jgi:hypothetical protein
VNFDPFVGKRVNVSGVSLPTVVETEFGRAAREIFGVTPCAKSFTAAACALRGLPHFLNPPPCDMVLDEKKLNFSKSNYVIKHQN